MATALYKPVRKEKTSILEDKRREAEQAAREFFLAKDINGVSLCWSGRVIRAIDKMPTIPAEKLAGYKEALEKVIEQANAANVHQAEAWRAYEVTAQFSAEKPIPFDLPQCQCEGCKMVEENNQRIANLNL